MCSLLSESSAEDLTLIHPSLQEVTIATEIEQVAADLVLDLLGIAPSHFPGRSITTGATASNVLGLALGRQFAISRILGEKYDVAEDGFGGVDIDIFAAGAHASIRKAAALVGIGRSRVFDLTGAQAIDEPVAFDLATLEKRMNEARDQGRGVIVCPSYGEVNTVSLWCLLHSVTSHARTNASLSLRDRAPSRRTCSAFVSYAIRTELGCNLTLVSRTRGAHALLPRLMKARLCQRSLRSVRHPASRF